MGEPRKSAPQPAMQASKTLSLPTQSSDIPLVSIFCSDLSRLRVLSRRLARSMVIILHKSCVAQCESRMPFSISLVW